MVGVGTSKERVGTALTVRYASSGFCGACEAALSRLLEIWRGHWGIENRLHWVRDVAFGEDWVGAATDGGTAEPGDRYVAAEWGEKHIGGPSTLRLETLGGLIPHRTTPQQLKDPEDP